MPRPEQSEEGFALRSGAAESLPGPAHLDPGPGLGMPSEALEAGAEANRRHTIEHLQGAYSEFLDGYRRWGGYRYYGWIAQEDTRNFRGPAILSEADIVINLVPLLASRFPSTSNVHAEFNIANWTRADYDKKEDRTQRIDIAVSDLSAIVEGPEAQEQFRNLVHWLFVEVKWVPKGWWGGPWEGLEARKRVEAISKDAWRLSRHLALGRCLVAAVFIVDDECLFDCLHGEFDWPPDVPVMRASPSALASTGFGEDPLVVEALSRATGLAEKGKSQLPGNWPNYASPGALPGPVQKSAPGRSGVAIE